MADGNIITVKIINVSQKEGRQKRWYHFYIGREFEVIEGTNENEFLELSRMEAMLPNIILKQDCEIISNL